MGFELYQTLFSPYPMTKRKKAVWPHKTSPFIYVWSKVLVHKNKWNQANGQDNGSLVVKTNFEQKSMVKLILTHK